MRSSGACLLVGLIPWLLASTVAAYGTNTSPVPGSVRSDPRDPYFTLASEQLLGNRGEERIDVSVDAACGESAWVFDRVELEIVRSRFASAEFVAMPQAGCTACEPLHLRWYHEPTGHLALAVRVQRRLVEISCENQAVNSP